MTARGKMAEAQFFLDNLRRTELGSAEFRYNASACTSALYSSIQHLLYDYAKKFWPSITGNEYIDAYHVALLAKTTGNEEATNFVEWYNKLEGRINSNPDSKAALEARKMEIHRVSPPLAFHAVTWEQAIDIADRLEYGIMSPQGIFTSSGAQRPTSTQLQAVQGSTTAVFFRSYATRQVPDTLNAAADFIKSLIDEAESRFGPP